jgi:CRISPR-associated protein Csx10
MEIRLEIISPLCLASSVGATAGDVDSETETVNGVPVLRGKSLKGLLVEETANLLTALETQPGAWYEAATRLYGISGRTQGVLRLEDGWIFGLPRSGEAEELRENFEAVTTVRRQTAIDYETGAAEKHSLRSARLLRSGLTFVNKVTTSEPLGPRECGLLAAAVSALRRAGLSRNRGWGEVRTRLFRQGQDVTTRWMQALKDPSRGGSAEPEAQSEVCAIQASKHLSFSATLSSPVVLAKAGHDPSTVETFGYLPGSAILGSAAAGWLRSHPEVDDPATHPEFRKLFLDATVRWTAGYPTSYNRRSLPCPVSFVSPKGTGEMIYDLVSAQTCQPDWKPASGFIAFPEEDGESGELDRVKSKTHLRLHHQRDRELGRSDGDLFSYESLAANQVFRFQVQLDEPDLAPVVARLLTEGKLQLGRSRSAGYGGGADVKAVKEVPHQCQDSNELIVTLLSDYIGIDPYGCPRPQAILGELQERLGVGPPLRSFLKGRRSGGYVGAWRMPRPSHVALEAGSVLVFARPSHLTDERLQQAMQAGLGSRRAEGFGQFVVNLHGERENYQVSTGSSSGGSPAAGPDDPIVSRMLEERKLRNQLRKDAHQVVFGRPPSRSFLGRLRGCIKSSRSAEDLKQFLTTLERVVVTKDNNSVTRAGKKADKSLRKARINQKTMKEWLERWCHSSENWPRSELFGQVRHEQQWPLARFYLDIVLDRMLTRSQ